MPDANSRPLKGQDIVDLINKQPPWLRLLGRRLVAIMQKLADASLCKSSEGFRGLFGAVPLAPATSDVSVNFERPDPLVLTASETKLDAQVHEDASSKGQGIFPVSYAGIPDGNDPFDLSRDVYVSPEEYTSAST